MLFNMRSNFSSIPRFEISRCGFVGSGCVFLCFLAGGGGGGFLGPFDFFGGIGFGTQDA
jgi:hypothetical protein